MIILTYANVRYNNDPDVDWIDPITSITKALNETFRVDLGVYDTEKKTYSGLSFNALKFAPDTESLERFGTRTSRSEVEMALHGDVEYLRRLRDEVDKLLEGSEEGS